MIFILPGIALLLFFINVFYKGNTVESCLLFILAFLPLMNLKISTEEWGGFRIFDALSIYCLLFLVKDLITGPHEEGSAFRSMLFVALVIIVLIGGLASEFPARAYLNTLKFFPVFVFARFFLIEHARSPGFRLKALQALKASYLVALVFLFFQVMIGLKFTFYPTLGPNTIDPVFQMIRYPGIFYDSQANGQYLVMGSFLFLHTAAGITNRVRMLNYLVFGLGIVGALIAGSRSAFAGFLAGLLIIILVGNRRFRIVGVVLIAAGFGALKIAAPDVAVFERSRDLSEDYKFRETLWKDAINISGEHPWLGIGTDNYQHYVMRHAQNQYLEIEEGEMLYFNQPENGYLKLLVEWGLIGFIIFLILFLTPLIRGIFQRWRNVTDVGNSFFIAAFVSWMVAFTTVYSIADHRILIMMVSLLLLIMTAPAKTDRGASHAR